MKVYFWCYDQQCHRFIYSMSIIVYMLNLISLYLVMKFSWICDLLLCLLCIPFATSAEEKLKSNRFDRVRQLSMFDFKHCKVYSCFLRVNMKSLN